MITSTIDLRGFAISFSNCAALRYLSIINKQSSRDRHRACWRSRTIFLLNIGLLSSKFSLATTTTTRTTMRSNLVRCARAGSSHFRSFYPAASTATFAPSQQLAICSSFGSFVQRHGLATAAPTSHGSKKPTAVVFLNMGGPSKTDEVGDFLYRLFVSEEMIP